MITATLVGDRAVAARLAALPEAVRSRLVATMRTIGLQLEADIKSRKLSGQVLKVRTGTLRRSITPEITESAQAVEAIVGTNVPYGAIHEYGFHGEVTVKAHLRKIKEAWGRPIAPVSVSVSAHGRRVNLPERSFLRSALREATPHIEQTLGRALERAVTSTWGP